jgi:hypothetical protein
MSIGHITRWEGVVRRGLGSLLPVKRSVETIREKNNKKTGGLLSELLGVEDQFTTKIDAQNNS